MMNFHHKLLVVLLRLSGGAMLLAIGAMIMPEQWMVLAHRALGLGELPREPVVAYLARSASALYAMHGGMMLLASTDVPRFAPLIRYLAIVSCLFGAALVWIDWNSGLPAWWTALEGPPVVVANLIVLWLLRRALALSPPTGERRA